jgi:anti-anti-sigma factor
MFEFELKQHEPYLWVDLKGKLISDDDASKMMLELSSKISKKRNIVLLNLKELSYINSSGFNSFLKLLTIARNHDGDTILCNMNSNINQLLITTKLNTIFKIELNLENIEDYLNKK